MDGYCDSVFDPITDALFGIQGVDLVNDLDYPQILDPITNPPLSASGINVIDYYDDGYSYQLPPPYSDYSDIVDPPNLPASSNPTVGYGYDPSKVDWYDVGLGTIGLLGDIATPTCVLGSVPSCIVVGVGKVTDILSIAHSADQMEVGDYSAPVDMAADIADVGEAFGPKVAKAFGVGDILYEIIQGFYSNDLPK